MTASATIRPSARVQARGFGSTRISAIPGFSRPQRVVSGVALEESASTAPPWRARAAAEPVWTAGGLSTTFVEEDLDASTRRVRSLDLRLAGGGSARHAGGFERAVARLDLFRIHRVRFAGLRRRL